MVKAGDKLKRKNHQYGQLANKYNDLKLEIKKATELERKRILDLIDKIYTANDIKDVWKKIEELKNKINKTKEVGEE